MHAIKGGPHPVSTIARTKSSDFEKLIGQEPAAQTSSGPAGGSRHPRGFGVTLRFERLFLICDCGFGRQAMSRMHVFYKLVVLVRGTNIVRRQLGLAETYVPATDPKLSMVPIA